VLPVSGPPKTKRQTTSTTRYPLYRNLTKSTVAKSNVSSVARTLRPGYLKSHTAGFPQRYTETIRAFYPFVSSIATNTFQEDSVVVMNGAYAPITAGGGGNQPTAFAKLVAVYTKVFVKSAKVTVVVCANPTNSNSLPTIHGMTISTNLAALSGLPNATQSGLCTFKQLGISPDTLTLTLSLDIGKFFSIDDLLDNTLYACTSGANPTTLVYAHIWAASNFSGGTPNFYSYTVQVDYNVICTDPLPLT
jgi:hypothetical protein